VGQWLWGMPGSVIAPGHGRIGGLVIGLAYRHWGDGTVAPGMPGLVIAPGHKAGL
jgi:hypothetical protein